MMRYTHWHLISGMCANCHVMRQDLFSVANAVVISGGGVLSSLAGGALADKYAAYDPRVRLWVSFILSFLYLTRFLVSPLPLLPLVSVRSLPAAHTWVPMRRSSTRVARLIESTPSSIVSTPSFIDSRPSFSGS